MDKENYEIVNPYSFKLIFNKIKLCSINRKFVSGKFIPSKDYVNVKKTIGEVANKYIGLFNLETCKFIEITMHTTKDIDAPVKPILDALQKLIGDDKNVVHLLIHKVSIKKTEPEKLEIYITQTDCTSCNLNKNNCYKKIKQEELEAKANKPKSKKKPKASDLFG
jgi:Holliday junction resolvase RusA-like endonuclease